MADKCGEVADPRVERAVGIQNRPPPIQLTQNHISWRFGNSEKSKDRSKASQSSTSGGNVSANLSR